MSVKDYETALNFNHKSGDAISFKEARKSALNTMLSAAIVAMRDSHDNDYDFCGGFSMNMYYNLEYKIFEATISWEVDSNKTIFGEEEMIDLFEMEEGWELTLDACCDAFLNDDNAIIVC